MAGVKRRAESGNDGERKKSKVKPQQLDPQQQQQRAKLPKFLAASKPRNIARQQPKALFKKKKNKQRRQEEEKLKREQKQDAKVPDSGKAGQNGESSDEFSGSESEGSVEDELKKKDGSASKGVTAASEPTKSTTSREAHVKQKALAQERKAAKPNADSVARTKKLWERLRRKSHVPLDERKKLIAELYSIITGRVHEFVFKHDSVRVIQTALKYATPAQRKAIATELKGDYRSLAESKYAKFLLGKLLVHGDTEVRDMVVPEFYGNVKRLIRHPEASWILDDIYRTVATPAQRAALLREWYGTEFALFRDSGSGSEENSAELSKILEKNPEKRAPIMRYLRELINLLVQKKTSGFTMLHDAMLQYFLNTKPGSTEAVEFLELLKGDEEADLVRNLAFTKSGSRLMCLALAYANAKDRKQLLRMYRDTIKLVAGDVHGHTVLLTAYEVIDDTKLSSKLIFPELLSQTSSESERQEDLLQGVNHLTARIPLLYPFAGDKVKWLLSDSDQQILDEVRAIRAETSKKDPHVRRRELVKAASPTLLEFIATSAERLVQTSFGCQFIAEILFDAEGDKTAAMASVARTANSQGNPTSETPAAGRMLKSLVQGGRFNSSQKTVERVQPPLKFAGILYEQIKDDVMSWATKSEPFVIVALVECEDFDKRDELLKTLKKNRKALEELAKEPRDGTEKGGPASSAAKLLLEKLRGQ